MTWHEVSYLLLVIAFVAMFVPPSNREHLDELRRIRNELEGLRADIRSKRP